MLRLATRGSRLARWQAERVAELAGLRLGVDAELVVVSTEGDRRPDEDLHAMGGRGVFVGDVQEAVLDGRADCAVHSAKDLPSATPDGLVIAAVPERADPRDALVGAALDAIPSGGRVGTGSVRRRAQLAAARDDLVFGPLRGNVDTRLRKLAEEGYAAIVVAQAALERLGLAARAAEVLDPRVVLPQVAQGALAVECARDDAATRERLAAIDDGAAHRQVDAERSFLAAVGGGCDLPVGALATGGLAGALTLAAAVASLDGRVVLRATVEGSDPAELGRRAARELLEGAGGAEVLDLAAPGPGWAP